LGRALEKSKPELTDLRTGLKACAHWFCHSNPQRYGAIIFATHRYFGKDLVGAQEPVLLLTLVNQPEKWDGFLTMSEVMGLNLNADIVVLTACQSGLGRRLTGEGVMGMGRAFQYAGAGSVLMSLWSVSEVTSVKLVQNFFKHLEAGKSKPAALRPARLEIRDEGYDYPYFWAPFILVGEVN
jgi:CHAT domain-containing protein